MNTEFYVDSINPWGRSASGWQAQNRPPVITHKSTSPIRLSSPSAPASGGMKRVSGCPLPGATAAGCRLTVSASESSVHPPEAGGGRQCAEPISTGSPVDRSESAALLPTHPPPLQPRAAHSHTTSIAPPDVSLTPAHSPLVLQCRRRAHSVHVTSLAGEDPTKLDPDVSVYPTGHGKRSDVQLY